MSDTAMRVVAIPLGIVLALIVVFWTHDWLYLVVGVPACVLLALFGPLRKRDARQR
jgi:hypothetical protein